MRPKPGVMAPAALRRLVLRRELSPQPGAVGRASVRDFCGEAEANLRRKKGSAGYPAFSAARGPAP